MGFSTSGAVVIILIGCLVAFSVIVPTVFDITDTSGDAFSSQNDQLRDQKNTAIAIESFEPRTNENDEIIGATVTVTNEGATSLSVDRTDLVVNGEYYPTNSGDAATTIITESGDRSSSDIWEPDTRLEITIENEQLRAERRIADDGEDSVRITTERGIAATTKLTNSGGTS